MKWKKKKGRTSASRAQRASCSRSRATSELVLPRGAANPHAKGPSHCPRLVALSAFPSFSCHLMQHVLDVAFIEQFIRVVLVYPAPLKKQ